MNRAIDGLVRASPKRRRRIPGEPSGLCGCGGFTRRADFLYVESKEIVEIDSLGGYEPAKCFSLGTRAER